MIMLARLVAAVCLYSAFAFRSVHAQGQGNLGQLPACAQSCVAAVAQNRNCVLATPECICPGQFDIDNCINRSCSISDLASSHAIIGQFCLGAIGPTAPQTSTTTPVVTAPTITPPTIGPPPPLTTTTSSPLTSGPVIPSLPTITPLVPSLNSSSLIAPSTSSSSLSLVVASTSLTLPASETQQTVVVFSTQFAPPINPNSGSSLRDHPGRDTVVVFISVVISGVVGILVI